MRSPSIRRSSQLLWCSLTGFALAACGHSSDSTSVSASSEDAGASDARSASEPPPAHVQSDDASAASDSLRVAIDAPPGVELSSWSTTCDTACVDLTAVASGGHAPYTYAWADGIVGATRTVCPTERTDLTVSVTDTPIVGEFSYVAQTVSSAFVLNLGCGVDGGTPSHDSCNVGEAGSQATSDNLNLFGDTVYFNDGHDLAAGHYRVTYLDGCMKFNWLMGWTVNPSTSGGWWLVGATQSNKVVQLPGPTMMYQSLDDCSAAGVALPPLEFDFAGGPLGIWLDDFPYQDNVAGDDGRNPKWRLQRVSDCEQETL